MDKDIKEKQVVEAKRRLSALTSMGLHPDVSAEFAGEGKVNVSTRICFGTVGFESAQRPFCRADAELEAILREFEERTGAVVYHATSEPSVEGDLLDLLFVARDEGEWRNEAEALEAKRPRAFVVNLDEPHRSGYRDVAFRLRAGGLVRIA